LNNKIFDIWADDYDKDVDITDDDNKYPFAGYKDIINDIYNKIIKSDPAKILDIGIGTGILAAKLYEFGNNITGVDFSENMLAVARKKMPNAELIQFDFAKGLPPQLDEAKDAADAAKFDFIISTYAMHHLTDAEKISFIKLLLEYLSDNSLIIIGDIGFENRNDLEECAAMNDGEWDEEEFYFVFSELNANEELKSICMMSYRQFSHCAGIIEIKKS